jgi:hypothetical protein
MNVRQLEVSKMETSMQNLPSQCAQMQNNITSPANLITK